MVIQPKMTKEDLRWQAEEDARTLVRAEEIKKDKSRSNRAVKQAKENAIKAAKEANTVSKSTKSKLKSKPVAKRPGAKKPTHRTQRKK